MNFITSKPRSRRPHGSRTKQRGIAAIESALVLLPFLAMFFGIVDISVAVFVRGCIQNAVREGVRSAITYQSDAQITTAVQSYALGFLSGTNASRVHVNYYAPGSTTPFANGGNSPGNIVEVSVISFPWNWMVPLTGTYDHSRPSSFSYSLYSYDVMGGIPAGGAPAR